MKLLGLVCITMVGFAANSILTRMGVNAYGMEPLAFAVIRVAAGALTLGLLVIIQGQSPFLKIGQRWKGALALTTYIIGFSTAYLSLDAGMGALILFGLLQIMMFGWAIFQGQTVTAMRWVGAIFALIGLVVLLWPSGEKVLPLGGTLAMIVATAGWAVYTILGQALRDPLQASAGNFILCLPLVAVSLVFAGGELPLGGIVSALFSGAVTSGLAYALWYRVLPHLNTTIAAVAQLSVPVLAVGAGVVFLAEPLTLRLLVAGFLVLGGIAVANIRSVSARRK
jgi:drug/metabolite transporter (DMT)-like permease